MTNNGRSTMRTQGKVPSFLVIGLLVTLCILGYGYWDASSDSNAQSIRILTMSDEIKVMSSSKLESLKKGETSQLRINELEDQLRTTNKVIDALRTDLQSTKVNLEGKSEELKKAADDLEQKHTYMEQCETEKISYAEQVQTLRDESESLKQQLALKPAQCDQNACEEPIQNILVILAKKLGRDPIITSLQEENAEAANLIPSDVGINVQPAGVAAKPQIDSDSKPGQTNITLQYDSALHAERGSLLPRSLGHGGGNKGNNSEYGNPVISKGSLFLAKNDGEGSKLHDKSRQNFVDQDIVAMKDNIKLILKDDDTATKTGGQIVDVVKEIKSDHDDSDVKKTGDQIVDAGVKTDHDDSDVKTTRAKEGRDGDLVETERVDKIKSLEIEQHDEGEVVNPAADSQKKEVKGDNDLKYEAAKFKVGAIPQSVEREENGIDMMNERLDKDERTAANMYDTPLDRYKKEHLFDLPQDDDKE